MLESPAEAQCVWSFANVSAEELARLSSVPRALEFDVDDQDPDVHLSASIPADFRGYVDMAAPQLLVEVSVKKNRSDDDDKSDDDGGGTVMYWITYTHTGDKHGLTNITQYKH